MRAGGGGWGWSQAWAAESFPSFPQGDVRHFPALNGKELSMHPQHTHTHTHTHTLALTYTLMQIHTRNRHTFTQT